MVVDGIAVPASPVDGDSRLGLESVPSRQPSPAPGHTATGSEPMTTPPPEPMLLFVAVSSALYTAFWRLLWTLSEDDGVELEYSEPES